MKISHRNAAGKYIYDARLGERPLRAICLGGKQLYPDNAARIRLLRLDMGAWHGTVEGAYWRHALEAVSAASGPMQYIRLQADRSYQVQTTFGHYPLASCTDWSCFTFAAGEGPLVQNIRLGDSTSLRLQIPAFASQSIGGTQGDDSPVSHAYPACLPGTEVRCHFTKGQKRVSTGARVLMESRPSGAVLLDRYHQKNGHCRGSYDWNCGWVGPWGNDTQALMTVWPVQARGPWGGYLLYPSVSLTLYARIIQIQPEA